MYSIDSLSNQFLHVLLVPVIRWRQEHGLSHLCFKKQAKQLFYRAVEEELRKNNIKPSTAALVSLSGLYKLALQLPKSLRLEGTDGFEGLVAQFNEGAGKYRLGCVFSGKQSSTKQSGLPL